MSAPEQIDEFYLRRTLELARQGGVAGEVPVGALVVLDNEIIGEGWNQPIGAHDPTAHAEIIALRMAARRQQNYRLGGATLYVTLEPCLMCMGAMIHARLSRLVFGAYDPKVGAASGEGAIQVSNGLNHQLEVLGGILESECAEMLRAFFRDRRR